MAQLSNNDLTPDFKTVDYLGNKVQLSSYQGSKVLLSFFRGASCPFCNMRLHELIEAYPMFKASGLQVITIFSSSAAEIAEFAGRQAPPFPIIADPAMELYRKYGVKQSSSGMIKTIMKPGRMWKMMRSDFFNTKSLNDRPIVPADFLINPELQIDIAYYGNDFSDHIPIQEIENWAAK